MAVFAAVAIAHVAVPVRMIAQREATLRLGRAYRFRTAPVDPYDAFRGRFVWLGYEQNHARWRGEAEPSPRSMAYALVEEGQDGFAFIREVELRPPTSGDFVRVEQVYRGWGTNSGVVYFTLPFDRYYMEETEAPRAERAYSEHSNRRGQTNHNTYAVVRIKDGDAVLENLYVDAQPITEILRHQPK
jgi:uncharacterized membrane-anchored protein